MISNGNFGFLGFSVFFFVFWFFFDFFDLFGDDREGHPMNPHTEFSQPPQDSFGIS